MANILTNNEAKQRVFAHELSEIPVDSLTATLDAMETGIVFYTGSTASGKSTSQMKYIDHLNESRYLKIMTVEDPIEFTYRQNKCSITQYEAGKDVPSIPIGIRILSNTNPDVLQVSEIRDFETVARVILAASSMLVLTAFHVSGPLAVYDRMVECIPKSSGVPNSQQIDFVEILDNTPMIAIHHERTKNVKVLKYTPRS